MAVPVLTMSGVLCPWPGEQKEFSLLAEQDSGHWRSLSTVKDNFERAKLLLH